MTPVYDAAVVGSSGFLGSAIATGLERRGAAVARFTLESPLRNSGVLDERAKGHPHAGVGRGSRQSDPCRGEGGPRCRRTRRVRRDAGCPRRPKPTAPSALPVIRWHGLRPSRAGPVLGARRPAPGQCLRGTQARHGRGSRELGPRGGERARVECVRSRSGARTGAGGHRPLALGGAEPGAHHRLWRPCLDAGLHLYRRHRRRGGAPPRVGGRRARDPQRRLGRPFDAE